MLDVNNVRQFPTFLRKSRKALPSKGAYLRSRLSESWHVGDCIFHFRRPRSAKALCRAPSVLNVFDDLAQFDSAAGLPVDAWSESYFYSNEWLCSAPLGGDRPATLRMVGGLAEPFLLRDGESANFFDPVMFESALADYLTAYFGHQKAGNGPGARHCSPSNRGLLPISPSLQALRFDIHEAAEGNEKPLLHRMVVFPASPQHLITLNFRFDAALRNEDQIESQLELADEIISSMRLEVGPKTLAAWEMVKAERSDMKLAEEFAQLPWPVEAAADPRADVSTSDFGEAALEF